jgi:hypothetical protein
MEEARTTGLDSEGTKGYVTNRRLMAAAVFDIVNLTAAAEAVAQRPPIAYQRDRTRRRR